MRTYKMFLCLCVLCSHQSVTTSRADAFLWPMIDTSQCQQRNNERARDTSQLGNEAPPNVTHESHEGPSSTVDEHSSDHKHGHGRLYNTSVQYVFQNNNCRPIWYVGRHKASLTLSAVLFQQWACQVVPF